MIIKAPQVYWSPCPTTPTMRAKPVCQPSALSQGQYSINISHFYATKSIKIFIFINFSINISQDQYKDFLWFIISQGPQINLQGGVGYHWEPDSWKELGGQEESREKSQKHCGEFDMWTQNDKDVFKAAFFPNYISNGQKRFSPKDMRKDMGRNLGGVD